MSASLQNVLVLSRPYLESAKPADLAELKTAYKHYLMSQQPSIPVSSLSRVDFVADPERRETLSVLFREGESAPTKGEVEDGVLARAALARVRDGYDRLKELDSSLGSLFDLVVDQVFVMRPPRGVGSGSSYDRVGLVYVNPDEAWSDTDVVECLMHEFAHTLLYIDALRYGHHPDYSLFSLDANFAETAILGRPRPMFFVFQSILIAVEILGLRFAFPEIPSNGIHGSTESMISGSLKTLESCFAHPNFRDLTTPRFEGLLRSARRRLLSFSGLQTEAAG